MSVRIVEDVIEIAVPDTGEALVISPDRKGGFFVQGASDHGSGWYVGDFPNFYAAMRAVRAYAGGAA